MPQDHQWPESHAEQTDLLPAISGDSEPESNPDGGGRHAQPSAAETSEEAEASRAAEKAGSTKPSVAPVSPARHAAVDSETPAAASTRHVPRLETPRDDNPGWPADDTNTTSTASTRPATAPAPGPTESTQLVPKVDATRPNLPARKPHTPPAGQPAQRPVAPAESTTFLPSATAPSPPHGVPMPPAQATQHLQSPQQTQPAWQTRPTQPAPRGGQGQQGHPRPAGSEYPTQVVPAVPPGPQPGQPRPGYGGHDGYGGQDGYDSYDGPDAPGQDLPGGNGGSGGFANRLREKFAGGDLRKPGLVAAAVFGFLVLVYGFDLLITSGDVPRGTTIAGVEVGGMSHSEAEDTLRAQLEPRMTQPVQYVAGTVKSEFDPKKAGLDLDWQGTIENAGDQPLNPFTRIASFFSTTEAGVVTAAEPNQLENAMTALQNEVNQKPVEGNIVFEGATPVPVQPKHGQELDAAAAERVIKSQWASGHPLNLPVHSTPVHITAKAVQTALDRYAVPAVSGPVVVHGEGKDGVLEPEEIAAGLKFVPKGDALVPQLQQKKLVAGVGPELKSTEKKGKDAKIVFEGGQPTVEPSVDGNIIKWDVTFKPLPEVLQQRDGRELNAHYKKQPAKLTTAEANALGIKEVIGEFTTGGFATESGINIRVVAEDVDGTIVKPGETFSLNQHTGPRTKAKGYVESGIIEDGIPAKGVGGGISQFATTLYNAYYFAGLKDVEHKEHSFYISRYPMGREATVFQGENGESLIDVAFNNDAPTGVAIQTIWTPSDITVRLWGTKRYDVESSTGKKTNITKPKPREVTDKDCEPSDGAEGFTVTDTRTIRDLNGQVVDEQTRTVKYNPQPKIVCKNPGD